MLSRILMHITTSSLVLFALAILVFPSPMAMADQAKEELAVQAAEYWLSLVDTGKYENSWESACTYFRNAVTKEDWTNSMNAFRKPLGKLIERNIIGKQYLTSLPGAPDGEYVVIQYSTSFENKKTAVETITPMRDADGVWRISGYFIK